MANAPLVVTLDGHDALSGARVRLRAEVRATVAPALASGQLAANVVDALNAAIAHGQSRYGMYRDELPDRRAAAEAATRPALEAKLAQTGHQLRDFALVALTLAPE